MFSITDLNNTSILRIYSEKKYIDLDPSYQRTSGIWDEQKKQLLIDTVINELDIPKFYFHQFLDQKTINKKLIKYAVIDGKQRLETIWGFIENKFSLAPNFSYFHDSKIKAGGMNYRELARNFPDLKIKFDGYTLPIVSVLTSDLDLIEEMFLRLNQGMPLNAAEMRNAIGGPYIEQVKNIILHPFFTINIPYPNTRYYFEDLAAKMLLLTYLKRISDVSSQHLDRFAKDAREKKIPQDMLYEASKQVIKVLDSMSTVFHEKDSLLQTSDRVISSDRLLIFFLVFQNVTRDYERTLSRIAFKKFLDEIETAKRTAERYGMEKMENRELIEFDQFERTIPTTASSIESRFQTLRKYILLEVVIKGEKRFKRVSNLISQDLSGLNLSGRNLQEVDLNGADLTKAILEDADLTGAILENANLTEASLNGAFLVNADLRKATFWEADLREADLTGANLQDAVFYGADLTDAIVSREQLMLAYSLEDAIMPNGKVFNGKI